jgi:hypothetical protein
MKLTASQKIGLQKIAEKLDKIANYEDKVKLFLQKGKISNKRAAVEFKKVKDAALKVAKTIEGTDFDVELGDMDEIGDEIYDDDFDAENLGNMEELSDFPNEEESFEDELFDLESSKRSFSPTEKRILLQAADKIDLLGDRQEEIKTALLQRKIDRRTASLEQRKISSTLSKIAEELKTKNLDIDIDVK